LDFAEGINVRLTTLLVAALSILILQMGAGPQTMAAGCPERPACRGCGCKGGPGYRGPDGRCVGFKSLAKVCGNPPDLRYTFENAPGTGLNHDCALGLDDKATVPRESPSSP
jgi:hypothetical protein